jgi:Ferritin-like domain
VSRRPDRGSEPFPIARRPLLLGAGAVGAALALGGCGDPPGSPYSGGLRDIALAAALENQLVAVYGAALAAAHAGRLGAVPPAFTAFAQTTIEQHVEHAGVWNAILRSARKPTISGTPLSSQPTVLGTLGAASTVAQVAGIAAGLENQAARTFTSATAGSTIAAGIAASASIAPVEAMHAAVLQFIIGTYPIPDEFIGPGGAPGTELTV